MDDAHGDPGDGRQPTEEELIERFQEEMRRIEVPEFLAHVLASLSGLAFQKLGLVTDPSGGRDLRQSRLAIDAFAAVNDVLVGAVGADEAELYRSTLHQMRLAYARASAESGEGAGVGAGVASDGAETAEETQVSAAADEGEEQP